MIQHTVQHHLSEPFVVEVWGKLAGVVLKEGDAFRFHAIAPPFLELDGAEFAKPGLARLAAARLDPHTRDHTRERALLGLGQPLGEQPAVVILEARGQHA